MAMSVPAQNEDPFFFDREGLAAVAADRAVGDGLRYFKEHRVLSIDQDGNRLWGEVEDEATDLPCAVEVCVAEDGRLSLSCACDDSREAICRHQVAALYAYADQKEATDLRFSAAEIAIKDRVKRGRSEVVVEHLGGEPWFGTWQASSIAAATHFPRQYRVTIRSLKRRANICNCPDFLINQLGTCKHIEAVLHKVSKRKDYRRIKDQSAPVSYVYLAWDVEDAPRLTLHRCRTLVGESKGILDNYFEASGGFTGRLPDDFFRFVELIDGRNDVHLGEDAVDYARQMAADAAHRLRAERIRAQIAASNGQLPGSRPGSIPTRSKVPRSWPGPGGRFWPTTWGWARPCRQSRLPAGCGSTKGSARS